MFLYSGSRSGNIHQHDVRVPDHHIGTMSRHTQEVCGLRWSPDGKYLASGGNDNMLHIWGTQMGRDVDPLHTFTEHQAAVKVSIISIKLLLFLNIRPNLIIQLIRIIISIRKCYHWYIWDPTFFIYSFYIDKIGSSDPRKCYAMYFECTHCHLLP